MEFALGKHIESLLERRGPMLEERPFKTAEHCPAVRLHWLGPAGSLKHTKKFVNFVQSIAKKSLRAVLSAGA